MMASRPIKIFFPFIGDTVGGSHLSILSLIEELDDTLFDPVIVLHENGVLAEYLEKRGFNCVVAPESRLAGSGGAFGRLIAGLRCAVKLIPLLRQQKVDIVHTNDARMHLSWGPAARLAGIKFIWHQRTPMALGKSAYTALLAHELLVVSEYCRETCPRTVQKKARVLNDPVHMSLQVPDRQEERERILKHLSLPADTKLIAFVGNIQNRKRPLTFIETAKEIGIRYPGSVHYLIFGAEREPLTSQARQLSKDLGLESVCHFMGMQFPIETWLAGCDIYMTPAVNEGFGRVPIEAMMVGTPVIASKMGGHIEFIDDGENGLLVPPDDPSAFADAAVRLLSDPGFAAKMAERARQPAIERYSPKRHAEAVQSRYTALFGEQNNSGFKEQNDSGLATDVTFIIADMGSGGAQRVAVNLVKGWLDEGRRVHVITWKPPEAHCSGHKAAAFRPYCRPPLQH